MYVLAAQQARQWGDLPQRIRRFTTENLKTSRIPPNDGDLGPNLNSDRAATVTWNFGITQAQLRLRLVADARVQVDGAVDLNPLNFRSSKLGLGSAS